MKILGYIILISTLLACQKFDEENVTRPLALMETPLGFPQADIPDENYFTIDRWLLGKKLFYDPIMSIDYSISCASCHKQEFGFGDSIDFTFGVDSRKGVRNVPPLFNLSYHPYFTRDGGVPTLEMQVLVPIQEHNEFDFNIVLLADRLLKDSSYIMLSNKAYNRDPDAFVITRAIACFERSLLSGNSRFDNYINGTDNVMLDEDELIGMSIFFGDKANCASCHSGFNFTNYSFQNTGLYDEYLDEGRMKLTGLVEDKATFKVPSLRNVGISAPYMHDGSLKNLKEVVGHYKSGGTNHDNKNKNVRAFELSEHEENALIKFLLTLTDDSFIDNPLFSE